MRPKQEMDGIFTNIGASKLSIVNPGEPRPAFVGGSREGGTLRHTTVKTLRGHAERAARVVPDVGKESEGPNDPGRLEEQGGGTSEQERSQPVPPAVDNAVRTHQHDDTAAMSDPDGDGAGETSAAHVRPVSYTHLTLPTILLV